MLTILHESKVVLRAVRLFTVAWEKSINVKIAFDIITLVRVVPEEVAYVM